MNRCQWANNSINEKKYHDNEWGVPIHDDRMLFEFLILEGAQAGLSWSTILNKRDNYRKAFDNFDPVKVANYSDKKIKELLNNPGIVRNKLKVKSSVTNAIAFLKIQKEFKSFEKYIWQFTSGKPLQNSWKTLEEVPVSTVLSDGMSCDLK